MAAQKVFLTRFKVQGRGAFPFDMLRYDRACPTSGEDAANLDMFDRSGANSEIRTVELIMWSRNSHSGPTVDRWLSFGWSVVRDSIQKVS